jgi:hypothetical protein
MRSRTTSQAQIGGPQALARPTGDRGPEIAAHVVEMEPISE